MTSEAGGGAKSYHRRREGGAFSCMRLARRRWLRVDRSRPRIQAAPEGGEGETPHYHGHRERLRSRLREAGVPAPSPITNFSNWSFFAPSRAAT